MNEDPFNAMMSTLEAQLKGLRAKFDAYRARVESGDTAEAAFKAKTAEMKAEIAQGSNACSKMRTALANVEQHRDKFPHIDDRELGSRKAYVDRLDAVRASVCVWVCGCVGGCRAGPSPRGRLSLASSPVPLPRSPLPLPPAPPGRWRTEYAPSLTRPPCRASSPRTSGAR
jgi:hypothetical protein